MATWCEGVRSSQRIIEYVEQCLQESIIHFDEVILYPFRSNGGRSNGVTARIEKYHKQKHIFVSVYEHWNSDQINVKVSEYMPVNMSKDHDKPTVQFNGNTETSVQAVVHGIQWFLCQYFDIAFPNEWYVPYVGFKGICVPSDTLQNYAEDTVMPLVDEFCDRN